MRSKRPPSAALYRKRRRIEGLFGRLESVLNSDMKMLGHPRAALEGFTVAVLAYNVLALLKQLIEHVRRHSHPELDVSTYHIAADIAADYGPMLRLLAPQNQSRADDAPGQLVEHLLLDKRTPSSRPRPNENPRPQGKKATSTAPFLALMRPPLAYSSKARLKRP